MNHLEKLATHVSFMDTGGALTKLSDLKALVPGLIDLTGNGNYYLAVLDDEGGFEYGMYEFVRGDVEPQDAQTYLGCIFRGWGTGGSLREMRHTYFNPDDADDMRGYCFYLPIDAVIAALTHLKKYFD